MKALKVVYIILYYLGVAGFVFFSVWGLDRMGAKYCNYLNLIIAWAVVFLIFVVLLRYLKSKIFSLSTGKAWCATMGLLSLCATLGDTFYLFSDILPHNIRIEGKINQSLICLALWALTGLLGYFAMNKKS